MKNILVHGLGQNSGSWHEISNNLRKNGIDTICPNLFEITATTLGNYEAMYHAFSTFCNQ